MQYRVLGQTGLKVSTLAFGASSLGSVFRPVPESEGIATVRTALDLGINLIDVSPYYGLTKAETVLGKSLAGIPRDRYYLATKVGRYGEGEFDFSAARVTRGLDESLRRLGVDYVDLLQCHDIEFGSLDQVVNETIPALRKLRDQGKVRFIGITGYPLRIFREVLDRTDVDTVLSYCRYTINDTALGDLTGYLKGKRVGIINASPLSMGLLSDRGAPAWHPAPQALKDACARAATLCREKGSDLSKLAVQFSLTNPDITTTIVGTANPDNIRKNVAWAQEPIDTALLAQVQEVLRCVKNLAWSSGRPENN